MKRSRDDSSNTPSPSDSNASKRPPPKRAKASQACTSCRKHKTRCELLESSSYLSRCHRCEVLSISCSFETNAPPNLVADNSPLTKVRRHILKTILSAPEPPRQPEDCTEPTQSEILGSAPRPNITSPWEFLRVPGIPDWTATPMLAMMTLLKRACSNHPVVPPRACLGFTEVLTPEQKRYLLGIFESNYAPWLSLPLNALGEDPVLDLVRCTVASRHLDSVTLASAIMKHVFNPTPSSAIIQAFALLALWSPFDSISQSPSETHDSRLIASAAINMCSSLRFDQAATDEQVLTERRKLGAELTVQETASLAAIEQKKFMWLCVHNIESIVCIGTGRGISSKVSDLPPNALSPLNFTTVANARKTRMYLCSRIFDLTEVGLRLEMSEDHNKFEAYCDESAEILYRFEGLQRIVSSVPVVTDIEVFHAHMVVVYYYFCRLTYVMHTLRHMRCHIPPAVAARGGSVFFSTKTTRTGCGFALTCARDALASAEALLTTILSVSDKELLATAPDSVYAMISFAAAYVTTAKFLLLQSKAMRQFPGSSDALLTRTIQRLRSVSLSPDDNASRCARVISKFLDTWHEGLLAHEAEVANEATSEDSPRAASSVSSGRTKFSESTGSETTTVDPLPDLPSSFDNFDYSSHGLDQDNLFGPEFWQYLAEMPSTQITPAYAFGNVIPS
ncbi:hypothetical protein BC834DRAFT_868467 [Gloeopeniophorella convolvens]|nr:hypothetical protein BC834DRAFT_868467 [Gloeopeniophorella convolvens]